MSDGSGSDSSDFDFQRFFTGEGAEDDTTLYSDEGLEIDDDDVRDLYDFLLAPEENGAENAADDEDGDDDTTASRWSWNGMDERGPYRGRPDAPQPIDRLGRGGQPNVAEDIEFLIQQARDIQSTLASRQEVPNASDAIHRTLRGISDQLHDLHHQLRDVLSDTDVEVYRAKIQALQAAKHELRQQHLIRVEPSETIPIITIQDQFNVWEILSRQVQLLEDAISNRIPLELPRVSTVRPNHMHCTIEKRELLRDKVWSDGTLDLPAPIGTIVLNVEEAKQMHQVVERAATLSDWYHSHSAQEGNPFVEEWSEEDAYIEARAYDVPGRQRTVYVTGGDRLYQGELFTYPTRYFEAGHARIYVPSLDEPVENYANPWRIDAPDLATERYLILTNERGRTLEFGPVRGRHANMDPGGTVIAEEDLADAGDKVECDICQDDYEVGEKWRKLPCDHRYHADCIQTWLGSYSVNGLCPYRCGQGPPRVAI